MSVVDNREAATRRSRRAEELFHEMLDRPPHERAAALAAVCPDDAALAAEVQSLLDQPDSEAGFLATPALDMAARAVSGDGSSLIGKRIGVFEVQALLGVGGMGEVYRARDTRLGRSVAIKILPRVFTTDPERLARFEREARVLASLNHPNIGALYGLEEADGQRALVLEFVEGQTLRDRIGRSGLPLPEALAIARQIADALDAAHEKGIVHRDLKPANIMITPSGAVKVLDFGLAKLGGGEAGGPDLSKSPGAMRGETRAGAILGTAAYMSPEQARGLPVDKRTDIWAFGCVLYEMLTGRAAFGRDTVSDAIVAVLEREADWALLPKATPPVVARLLRRCLEKDARRRLRDIADARADLDELQTGAAEGATSSTDAPSSRAISRSLVAGLTLALIVIVAMGVWIQRFAGSAVELPRPITAHLTLPLPAGTRLTGSYPSLSISRDGTLVALVAEREGVRSLYLRGLAELDWKQLPGTEGAASPFFSPDGEWLAFFTPGKLLRVSLAGGRPQVISDALNATGFVSATGDWGADGQIVFSYWPAPGFFRVPAAGGAAERVKGIGTRAENSATRYRTPRVLPGGQSLLFNISVAGSARIEILPADSREPRLLVGAGTDAYLTRSGHLIYGWDNQILGVPFTSAEPRVRGVPVPVVEGVRRLEEPGGSIDFSVSENGTLVYAPGSRVRRRLVWADRSGKIAPVPLPPRNYRFPALSPNGDRVAVSIFQGAANNVWIGDIRQGNLTPLTVDGDSGFPLWSPDGKDVIFTSCPGGANNILRRRVDVTGDAELLTNSPNALLATGFSPDGRLLVFGDADPKTAFNIWVLPMSGRTPGLVAGSRAFEMYGTFSPDGRWLAYASNESGRNEVYVQAYPGPSQKKQISSDGGANARWNRNGREIFYTNEGRLMSASFLSGGGVRIGKPRMLFEAAMITGGWREYDVAADGERFLFVEDITPVSTELHVVVNWFEELKRRVPIARQLER